MEKRYVYFKMSDRCMDDGLRHSILFGDTIVCVPVKVGDIATGKEVAVIADGRLTVGVVSKIERGFVELSPYNPLFSKKRILTRCAEFYLIVETRHKRDGEFIFMGGLA